MRALQRDEGDEPQAAAPTADEAHSERLRVEAHELLWGLAVAELASPTVTRKRWIANLEPSVSLLHSATSDEMRARAEANYRSASERIWNEIVGAFVGWEDLEDRYRDEKSRLAGGASLGGVYALEFLDESYEAARQGLDAGAIQYICPEDYLALQSDLDNDRHLWNGELRAAQKRVRALKDMLEVVAEVRSAGKDEDAVLPGWSEREQSEESRLEYLVENAPADGSAGQAFQNLLEQLIDARSRAIDAAPPEKGVLEIVSLVGKGLFSTIVDPIIEGGKQLVDLVQIWLHFQTSGTYEPKFISDMAEAANQGQDTGDILKGMVVGLLETPKRWMEAVEAGDWEAIGRETANLYILAKGGLEGAAKARTMIRWARARGIGLRGGIGVDAALQAASLAREKGLIIVFRPTSAAAVRLRGKGHPPKPEFIKMKTIDEIDLHLGATKAELAQVGYFEPQLPKNMKRLDAETQAKVLERHDMRMKEWEQHAAKVEALEASGQITREGNLIIDAKTGKSFTSDYDLWELRKPLWRVGGVGDGGAGVARGCDRGAARGAPRLDGDPRGERRRLRADHPRDATGPGREARHRVSP